MDALSEAALTALIQPALAPGESVGEIATVIREALEPTARRYETATTIGELLYMMKKSPAPILAQTTTIYHSSTGTEAEKLAATRTAVVSALSQALLEIAQEKRELDRATGQCTLHPHCNFYRGSPRIRACLLELDLASDHTISAEVIDRLDAVDRSLQDAHTVDQIKGVVNRMCNIDTARAVSELVDSHWRQASGTTEAKMNEVKQVILERLVTDATIEVQITRWRASTNPGSIMGPQGVTLRPPDDPEDAMIESLRVHSMTSTVLDNIPDSVFLMFFTTPVSVTRIRTQLKPLAIALQLADTIERIYGVINRIDGYDAVLPFIRRMAGQYLQLHATAPDRLNQVRQGILIAMVELESTAMWMATQ